MPKLSSNVRNVFPKVLKLSSEPSECKPLVGGVDRNNAVRCCALVPAVTPAAAASDAHTANGLHVIFLPFLDDIRHPEVGSSTYYTVRPPHVVQF
jgi:hypothetical protein